MPNEQSNRLMIFLCHSSQDKSYVRKLYESLINDGFDPWLDEEKLLPGQDWDYEIKGALKRADAILICLSNNSVSKTGYVQREIRLAIDLAKEQPEGAIFLIPARIEPCNIPTQLEHLHSPEIFTEKGYRRLNEALKVRAIKLNRHLDKDLTIAENKPYYDLLKTYFGQAFSQLFWNKFDDLNLKSPKTFTVGLVGANGTGKTTLIYTLANTDIEFNFLQTQPIPQSRYLYKVPLEENIFVIEYNDENVFSPIRGNDAIEEIKKEVDLIFFTLSPKINFGKNELQVFQELEKSNIPIAILATRMDRLEYTAGKSYLEQIQDMTKHIPLPVSAVEGLNLDLITKFIVKAKKFYV